MASDDHVLLVRMSDLMAKRLDVAPDAVLCTVAEYRALVEAARRAEHIMGVVHDKLPSGNSPAFGVALSSLRSALAAIDKKGGGHSDR